MIFELQVSGRGFSHLTFSPDSSYFLCGSIRSCVCIRKQKEVAFIPGGPEDIEHCSFSSCGKKLVTAEENFLKVWNVERRELLAQVEKHSDVFDRYYFSSCNNYVLELRPSFLVVRDSATLEEIHYACSKECLEECLSSQIVYLVSDRIRVTSHYHLYSAEELVVTIDIGGIDRRLLYRSLDASRDILKIQDGGRKRAKSSSDLSNIGK